ncbi:CBS domain-containing protein [Botrimarina hoheduenensis]|uniref:Inosine 5'-monophosphate dehydrogenase n=1 Tax=Botrimarina hoheduenensis TaxID=2528000 RepID=A0A5C5WAU4_9BACT|nr:CBS domain-containing protein [Botrimarina hoheduenensis]TWT47704.1 inosine 5'-monophosphate dehydrogenase [Botrimarina hoheduenensis]
MDFQLSLATESATSAYPEKPVAVLAGVAISEVVKLMRANRTGAIIVLDEAEKLIGVFTERDALRLMAEGADMSGPIESEMSKTPASITTTSTMAEAIRAMSDGGYRHLPMVSPSDPTQTVGMIDVRGILRYLVEHFPNTIYNLPPTPVGTTPEREGA